MTLEPTISPYLLQIVISDKNQGGYLAVKLDKDTGQLSKLPQELPDPHETDFLLPPPDEDVHKLARSMRLLRTIKVPNVKIPKGVTHR